MSQGAGGSALPLILIELVLVMGGVLAFGLWQIRSTRRDRERMRAERMRAERERAAAAAEPAPPAARPAPGRPQASAGAGPPAPPGTS